MKKSIIYLLLIIFLGTFINFNLLAFKPDDVLGEWLTEDKDAKIEIYKKDGEYYGKIIWLKEPLRNGKPKTDDKNPDKSKRERKLLGLVIMTHFIYDEDGVWEDGNIYDPKSGNTYSCKMTLSKDKKTLEVRGYIGISLFGRTSVWTKTE